MSSRSALSPNPKPPLQDVSSRSALVRCYYRRRAFMCFCCVCCEVLYLALYLLHWPAFRAWRPLPVHVPAAAAAWLQGAPL